MALIFCDSFDHYATADRLLKWTADSPNAPSIQATGRFTNALVCAGQTNGQGIRRSIGQNIVTGGMGFAYLSSAIAADIGIGMLLDSTTEQLSMTMDGTGLIQLRRGAPAGTVLATGTHPLSSGTWYYIEIKATIANAAATAEVWLNGVLEATFTGDTQNTANAFFNGIRFFNNSSTNSIRIDDHYVFDTTGSAPNNDRLGDVRVECLFPNGNGNSSQFVGSDADSTDNYLLVDDTTQDGDSTYVESSTVTDKDTYTMTDLTPGTGTVYGAQSVLFARKTDAGTRSIKSVARLSATETDSADKGLSTTYLYYPDMRETKPGGGVWTVTDVNNSEWGQKVTA